MTKPLDENLGEIDQDPVPTKKHGIDDPAVRELLSGFIGAVRGVPARCVAIKRHGEPDDSTESLERRRQALIDEEKSLGKQ
ncbi:hypothetical protein A2881_05685 [Candidatus Peribacteria bacterium RIFCSPHIGHO2_01_FULL_55_13]|nr:MAG: hypothetical protein A2881_05685 [Candidatus Peribacteria bacterium RIFCSPHIGHO2_01_FULL_55_13]OGJ65663.1 MAG: hypothetical protein A3F36_04315 [Candidatus Peribacteria bacterium RIFCSPHIGHO2_12_FULL_55_11]